MANITAADVNKLRTITGAGMMDCKKALVLTEGGRMCNSSKSSKFSDEEFDSKLKS